MKAKEPNCPHCQSQLKYIRGEPSTYTLRVYSCGRVIRRNLKNKEIFAIPCDPVIAAASENWFYKNKDSESPAKTARPEYTKFTPFWPMLRVPLTATEREIKRAYRKRSKELHPDKPGGSDEDFRALKCEYEKALQEQH